MTTVPGTSVRRGAKYEITIEAGGETKPKIVLDAVAGETAAKKRALRAYSKHKDARVVRVGWLPVPKIEPQGGTPESLQAAIRASHESRKRAVASAMEDTYELIRDEWVTAHWIAEQFGITPPTARKRIRQLEREGRVEVHMPGNNFPMRVRRAQT